MKAIKITGRVLQALFIAVLVLIMIANLWLACAPFLTGEKYSTFFGLHWAVVLSGSMEPEIGVDDLVVTLKQDEYSLRDIITFEDGHVLTTHRIVAVGADGYTTQGDANNTVDRGAVAPERVVGKVILTVPRIGAAIAFLRTPLGLTLILAAGIAMIELPHLLKKKNSEGSEYEDQEKNEN